MIVLTRKHREDGVWHPWFAWHPVWTGLQLRWLEYVERKLTPCYDGYEVSYRPLDLENYP